MATAVDQINNQMMQSYSAEANVNEYANRTQAMRRRGAGRGARLTGRGAGAGARLATAAQLNPTAVKRGRVAGSRKSKSLLEYAQGVRGRFFKKNKTYARFLTERNDLKGQSFEDVVSTRSKQKGHKRSRKGREGREARKLQNMYKQYVKDYTASLASDIAAV